jgi:hypothetical protein
MTTHKTFKRRVRARMAKTGESYTAARRMLIAQGDRPESTTKPWKPVVSDEAVARSTGHGWQHWFDLLDGWGATAHTHTEIARWLHTEHDVPGWWSQSVTVGYEQARGLRAPGQHAEGWAITASRTIEAPVEEVFEAFRDPRRRARWLPSAEMRLRTATAGRSARFDWEDGSTRVIVGFTKVTDARSRVALEHARLADSETADEMKAWWRDRLMDLKRLLEGDR